MNENKRAKVKKEEQEKKRKRKKRKKRFNKKKKQIDNRNNNKKWIITEKEKIYLPLKAEYIDNHYSLDTNENKKEEKEEKHVTVSKKESNLTKDYNINKK